MRRVLVGAACFLLGSMLAALAQTALRPDQFIALSWAWAAPQRVVLSTPAISTSTFTPDMNAGQDFKIVLVHSACPCTIANPSNMPSAPQHGVIEVDQSANGSDRIGTWGSQWEAPGGVAALALSTSVNAQDFFSYDVVDSTHILIAPAAAGVFH